MSETLLGRIERLKKELLKAETELQEEQAKTPEVRLADLIHNIRCKANHVDDCGWFYEKNDDYLKNSTTRNHYYKHAVKILANEDIDTVVRIISKFADTR
jgi:hypothetical protein